MKALRLTDGLRSGALTGSSDLDYLMTYIETELNCAKRDVKPYTKEMIRKAEHNSKYENPFIRYFAHEELTEAENDIWQDHLIKNKGRNQILRLKKILKQVLEFEG